MSGATSILELKDGLHPDFAEHLYHRRIPGVASKHLLDLVAETPAHAAAYLAGAVEEDKEAFRFGTAVHAAVLEPERFAREFLVLPKFGDLRKKENKASREGWLRDHVAAAEVDGVLEDADTRDAWVRENTISQADMTAIRGMAQSVSSHPEVLGHLYRGKKELTIKWTDRETGVICKGRADLYDAREGVLVDLKTCRKASLEEFAKSVTNYRYYVQDPWYCSGLRAVGADLRNDDAFLFVAVEKTPPYACAVFHLDEAAIRHGRSRMRRDLTTFAHCLEVDEWPSYPTAPQKISLKPWAFQ